MPHHLRPHLLRRSTNLTFLFRGDVMSTQETWVDFPEHPAYQVSNGGRVRRKINKNHPERNKPFVYMKFDIDKDGYQCVRLSGRRWRVNRLVYKCFVGPLVPGLVVCHVDGNKQNNEVSNLLQATQLENIQHKKQHGTWQSGENHPSASITNSKAKEVKAMLSARKYTLTEVAQELCVSRHVVADISRGRAWRTA